MSSTGTKITELTQHSGAPASGDLVPMVDDPSGTPETKKITIGDFLLAVETILTFNEANKIIKIDPSGRIPQLDGSLLTGVVGNMAALYESSTTETVNLANYSDIEITVSGQTLSVSGQANNQRLGVTNTSSGDASLNFDLKLQNVVYTAPSTMSAGDAYTFIYKQGEDLWLAL
jgi:hypothetical protein